MSTNAELACVYAALILADDDVNVSGDKLATIIKAAGVDVEPYWPDLFASALQGIKIKELITNIGSGAGAAPAGGAAPAAAAPAAAAPAAKKEKEPEPEESDDDMGLGLFD